MERVLVWTAPRVLAVVVTTCLLVLGMDRQTAYAVEPVRLDDRIAVDKDDWPWWRGPWRNGEASPHQRVPQSWSETENIAWKVPLPGRGHGSVCIYGPHLFLLAADEAQGSQSVLCLDRASGAQRWATTVHAQGGMRKNEKSTLASSTPACDGQRVYVNFPNAGRLITTALDLQGKIVWQTPISDYTEHQGYGASPALYQKLVIVSSDNKGGGALVALDRVRGTVVWQRERPRLPNYPSPILLHAAGKDQLVLTGCDLVSSFDPLTGATLWEVPGATTECVTSTVTDGTRIFTSGGYPKNHISAVRADGSGKLEWENELRLYVPSPLYRDGYLYGILDAGIAVCLKADTGAEQWKVRLGGTFSSSPTLVGHLIYATNEAGETFIFHADPSGYTAVAKNQLGEEILSSPVLCGGRIYYRAAILEDGKRVEYLYCISDHAQ